MPLGARRGVTSTRVLGRGARLGGARGALSPGAGRGVRELRQLQAPVRCSFPPGGRRASASLAPLRPRRLISAGGARPLPLPILCSPPSRSASAQGLPRATLLRPGALPWRRGTLAPVTY